MFESYLYRETVSISEIKSLLLRTIISGPDKFEKEAVCTALLDAFMAALEARENPKKAPGTIKGGAAAEKLFLDVFEKFYGEEELQPGVAEWPEILVFEEDRIYPKSVIVIAAKALAQKAKAERDAWYEYCRENYPEDYHDSPRSE